MKAKSEGRRQNEECRSGEKLGSGIRAQPLGCRGLRQLWRNRERHQIVESELTVRREPRRTGFEFRCPHQTVFWGWLSNLVEREEVIKFLTVRNLMSPGDCRNAAVRAAPLATSATSNRAAVGSGIGAVRRRRPAWAVCGGCRLKAAFPDRVRRPRPAWLSAHGRQALGPAWPQPAAPPMHRPVGKPLDQDWRGRNSIWAGVVGCGEVLNGRMGRPKI